MPALAGSCHCMRAVTCSCQRLIARHMNDQEKLPSQATTQECSQTIVYKAGCRGCTHSLREVAHHSLVGVRRTAPACFTCTNDQHNSFGMTSGTGHMYFIVMCAFIKPVSAQLLLLGHMKSTAKSAQAGCLWISGQNPPGCAYGHRRQLCGSARGTKIARSVEAGSGGNLIAAMLGLVSYQYACTS